MKRAFTVVELMVVVVVISILVAFAVTTYDAYQKRSYDAEAKALAGAVKAGAEAYYNRNNEYPLASDLYGGTPNGSTLPSSYNTAGTMLNVPATTLGGGGTKLMPCDDLTCTIGNYKNWMYYVTKSTAASTAAAVFTIGGCTYTLNSPDNGGLSFMVIFYSYQQNKWLFAKSNQGTVTSSDSNTCPFTAL